jgi:hypothetical protein
MHRSIITVNGASALLAIALSSCVTINIYFPAAAAERAADRIIDEVLELKPAAAKPADDKPAASKAAPQ